VKTPRSWLLLAALAIVAAPAVADARAKHSKATGKSKAGKRSKSRRATGDNMPKGFAWPPNETMRAKGEACKQALTVANIAFSEATPQKRVPTPIELTSMEIAGVRYVPTFRKPPFTMDCHLALALQQHSEKLFALGVREVRFSRIYGYTKVRTGGRTKNVLSRHALGMAMDIYAVVDDTGRVAVVATDYKKGDELLLAVEQTINECHGFRTVLSPKNDRKSHHDHFHIEAAVDFSVKPAS